MRFLILIILCLALAGCGLDESLSRSDRPTSRDAASKVVSVPFPPSAKEIYYVVHSVGMQEFQLFVRFTVEPNEMDKALEKILADYNARSQHTNVYKSVPVAAGKRWSQIKGMAVALLPIAWWDTDSIPNGYYYGPTNDFGNIHVWTDVARNQIYLCIHD